MSFDTRPNNTPVSIIIPTLNRPDSARAALESVLNDPADNYEVLLVDQSDKEDHEDGNATHLSLENWGLLSSSKVRYFHTDPAAPRSKSKAVNYALEYSNGEIILFTDDDCRVKPKWSSEWLDYFNSHSDVDFAYGRVRPGFSYSDGWIPDFDLQPKDVASLILSHRFPGVGLGANMAFRRKVFEKIGLFNESFGPGTTFRGGDDYEVGVRALLAGFKGKRIDSPFVKHDGIRVGKQLTQLQRGNFKGLGGVEVVAFKQDERALSWITNQYIDFLTGYVIDLAHFKKPRGLIQIIGFTEGVLGGIGLQSIIPTFKSHKNPLMVPAICGHQL